MTRRLMLKISGEIGTKSPRTRRRFLRALERNVKAALDRAGLEARVRNRWSRFLVHADDLSAARDALAGVFGIHSLVEVAVVRFEGLDDLVERAAALSLDRVRGKTFVIRPKRSGAHDFTSRDVAIKLGDALRPGSAGVNLDAPQVEVAIEIAEREAYL
ncbi:MAG TPA: THUMP domain-containing protein, partial [Actinomycetota bacterium]|nr:THUMP domain-containing protein [Actinomycetota bacterium]